MNKLHLVFLRMANAYFKKKFTAFKNSSWLWINSDPKITNNSWHVLNKTKTKIKFNNGSIWLKPKEGLSSGWYFLGINHQSKDKRIFGIFSSKKFDIDQGRPMYPNKWRWRIVRIKPRENYYLHLCNGSTFIELNNICLIPIPLFFAKIKINRRLNLNTHSNQKYKKLSSSWRSYNKLLNSQRIDKKLISYKRWINKIEYPFYKKIIPNNSQKLFYKSIFIIFNEKMNFKEIDPDKWIITLNSGDELNKNALFIFKKACTFYKNTGLFYCDEDTIDLNNKRIKPHFKTAWNRELFWNDPGYSSIWIIKGEYWNKAIKKLTSIREKRNLRSVLLEVSFLIEIEKKDIRHLPYILYHKSITNQNSVLNNSELNFKELKILSKFLSRYSERFGRPRNLNLINNNMNNEINWKLEEGRYLSVIIPTTDKKDLLKKCIDSLLKFRTKGIQTEIIVMDCNSIEFKTINYFNNLKLLKEENLNFKIIKFSGKFNYSTVNNIAAKAAKGNILLFLNNDTEFTSYGWDEILVTNASRPDIGFVGPKLIYVNNKIQHAGIVLGIGGAAGHSHKYFDLNDKGYKNKLVINQEVSAVTGACMAIKKKTWDNIGGFDELSFAISYNDVDVCLRANLLGLRNIFLSNLCVIHKESLTRGVPLGEEYKKWRKEYKNLRKYWGKLLSDDPYYSPYLTLDKEDYSLSERCPENIYARKNLLNNK